MWRCGARRGLSSLRRLSGGHAHHRAWRWNSNRACERALHYQLGDKIHGFTINQLVIILCIHFPHKIPRTFRISSRCIWTPPFSHVYTSWISGRKDGGWNTRILATPDTLGL
nr:presequence protease, mitochondrial-like [Chlorocebus sabaeus]